MINNKDIRELIDRTCEAKGTTADQVLLRMLFLQTSLHGMRTAMLNSTVDAAMNRTPPDAGLPGTAEMARMWLIAEYMQKGELEKKAQAATDEATRLKHQASVKNAERSIAAAEATVEILRTIINQAEHQGVRASISMDEMFRDGFNPDT